MSKKRTNVCFLLGALALIGGTAVPTTAMANDYYVVQQTSTLTGTVFDETGEPLTGASVTVAGTTNGATVDLNGKFELKNVKKGAKINVSFIGYASQQLTWDGVSALDIVLKENDNVLNEAVVTAMGIVRKATSLTYSTQQLKSDDLMKVQDTNLVNGMEGKVSGVTITPSAGGAGGASKILLRGNKSIMGNNSPLIVVDGVPMTNNTRGQVGSGASIATQGVAEGGDPLSMINPDDIESMNVLKGANAAALYGSQAANGVVMITTKKGKEGKLDVSFNSNVTFDNPLLTPDIQNTYGSLTDTGYGISSWGAKLAGTGKTYTYDAVSAADFTSGVNTLHLRDLAQNDVKNFYDTGVTTNNSISLAGGTEKIKTYFSYANAHANGMVESNKYFRNTFAFRQNYNFWKRLQMDISANYVQTNTQNRTGGGTVGNPIYDLYTMPRDVDMDYYRNNYITTGEWRSAEGVYYVDNGSGGYTRTVGRAYMSGEMQNWFFQTPGKNNPYWLMNQNTGEQQEHRFYGSAQAKLDIYDGLAFQARVSVDYSRYNSESHKTATTWDPADLNEYGRYWLSNQRTNEYYTDYLLSYNKIFKEDWSVSATAGWVGHTIKGYSTSTDATATIDMTGVIKDGIMNPLPTIFNYFDPQAGGARTTSKSKSSNWDKAALATVQFGWKDMIYVDGSYRRDWYRAFTQFAHLADTPDNYGYFGFGGSAILSEMFKLAEPISYLKYRVSYSEVGNSIPNTVYSAVPRNEITGAIVPSFFNSFHPIPEKTKSFETGFESQFFNNALNFDVTYYNSAMCNSYLTISQGGKTQPVNTGKIRNQGIELTVGYDWQIGGGWRWKTNVNFSYNSNKIVSTYRDENGIAKELSTSVANGVQVRYLEGGKYGDMYVNDFDRWSTDAYYVEGPSYDPVTGELLSNTGGGYYTTNANEPGAQLVAKEGDIFVNMSGKPSFNGNLKSVNEDLHWTQTTAGKKYGRYLGNMNSDYQLSWANTFSYKNFNLYILVNGRIGGKVISLTESYLDRLGLSQRTADARDYAYANDLGFKDGAMLPISQGGEPAMYINEGRTIVPIQGYYETVGVNDASSYVYDATNFRLRELSFGYTWRNLIGEGKNLSLSVIGRNLFFIYKNAPVDPDVSLSTANGLGGFEMFNLPSSRSFGINLKLNF